MTIKNASLPPHILHIVRDKGTEKAYSGEYDLHEEKGTYLCRQCGVALFRAHDKFHSGCGWPSFDDDLPDSVLVKLDADGRRHEILCANCDAHLGHVFTGELFTTKNVRHCVNSASLDFVKDEKVLVTEEAIFAGGCFWGIEYLLSQVPGVLKAESGYTGGHAASPSYEAVCSRVTGHYEAVRVIFDPSIVSYESVTKHFFEIHDPTQANGQGPDLGEQYASAIFYYDSKQQQTALQLIERLTILGYAVKTKVLPVDVFWPAEKYHQQYYAKNNKQPYCHRYTKRFS